MIGRAIGSHVTLLVVAAAAAVFVWTRDKQAAVSAGEVTVWNGRPADVERLSFDSKARKLSLEARKDGQGTWWLGTSETMPAAAPDAGPPAPAKVTRFVSVGAAEKVVAGLAPLKALREVGRIDENRSAEFGLKEPAGTLTVVVGGKARTLTLGDAMAAQMGGGARYLRDDASATVYAVRPEVTRDLEYGETSLIDRETHGFKDADVEGVRISAHGKSRDILRRGPESKRIWADPADPEKGDETVSNWLAKVDRLKPTEYPDPQPTAPEPIARIDYSVKGTKGAFLEIAKVPSPPPVVSVTPAPPAPKSDYLVRSERTRLWAKVYAPVGEQVEQDLGSVVR